MVTSSYSFWGTAIDTFTIKTSLTYYVTDSNSEYLTDDTEVSNYASQPDDALNYSKSNDD